MGKGQPLTSNAASGFWVFRRFAKRYGINPIVHFQKIIGIGRDRVGGIVSLEEQIQKTRGFGREFAKINKKSPHMKWRHTKSMAILY